MTGIRFSRCTGYMSLLLLDTRLQPRCTLHAQCVSHTAANISTVNCDKHRLERRAAGVFGRRPQAAGLFLVIARLRHSCTVASCHGGEKWIVWFEITSNSNQVQVQVLDRRSSPPDYTHPASVSSCFDQLLPASSQQVLFLALANFSACS